MSEILYGHPPPLFFSISTREGINGLNDAWKSWLTYMIAASSQELWIPARFSTGNLRLLLFIYLLSEVRKKERDN